MYDDKRLVALGMEHRESVQRHSVPPTQPKRVS